MLAEMEIRSVRMGRRSKEFEREHRGQLTVVVHVQIMRNITKNLQCVLARPIFAQGILSVRQWNLTAAESYSSWN